MCWIATSAFADIAHHRLEIAGYSYRCSIGKSGVVANKREGDGGTPLGSFPIRKIYYRPDRVNPAELQTTIPVVPLTQRDAWCDDASSPFYNTLVQLPFKPRHETLWRDDHVYDIIVVLGYNDHPRVANKGSAIFLHIARKDYQPTEGCIAMSRSDLLHLISQLSQGDEVQTSLSGDCHVRS